MRRIAARRCATRVLAVVAVALLASVLLTGPSAAEVDPADLSRAEDHLAAQFVSRGLTYPPSSVTLIALKAEGRLELWAAAGGSWTFVRSYLVRATSGQLGPKLREGDHQVPEGLYRVSALNPHSRFHLSLRLDYPNAFDEAHARDDDRPSLGSDIMIHGDRRSDGCLPVGDDGIEELFALASRVGVENVAVVISPLDLRHTAAAAAAARVAGAPRWLRELYDDIAATLRAFPSDAAGDAASGRLLRPALAAPKCRPYDAADCEDACSRGDAASCGRAGVLYRDGRGVKRDPVKAWTLTSNACAHGDAVGCTALSSLVVADDGLRRDAGRAAALARAACDAGDGHGCAQLAQLCTDRLIYPSAPDECSVENVDRLRQRAVVKLKSVCSGWAAYDCFTLATIYASGDPATALRFAAGSCRAGDPGGCDELGTLYEQQGEGSRARDLFSRACAAGYAQSCERIARGDDRLLAAQGSGGG